MHLVAKSTSAGKLAAAANELRIRRILEQVRAHLRGEPVEADPPELVRADLVAERLARIVDRAGAVAPPPAPIPLPTPKEPELLDYVQAAAVLNIAPKTFANHYRPRIPGLPGMKSWRCTREQLRQFVRTRPGRKGGR